MGRYLFRLPDIGEGVAEAEIVMWHVGPGDRIAEDQSLVDVMTDKATVDMTSPVDGVVTAVHGAIGTMLPVGAVLVELEVEGAGNTVAAVTEIAAPAPAGQPSPSRREAEADRIVPSPRATVPVQRNGVEPVQRDAPRAGPATRRRAYDMGIALRDVTGTGPGDRITRDDLDAYATEAGATIPATAGRIARIGIRETPIIGMRRKIAEKMQEAKRRIPHIAYIEECDLTELEALRVDLNRHRAGDEAKLTLLPFFIQALVKALPDFPQINARYDDDAGILHSFEGVHVGIATQTPAGLMVPVVRHAEAMTIRECAAELARITRAARDGSATREELSGSTITITSLGPLGGIATTPIINHPEVAIIGPNKLVDRPMVQGAFVTMRKSMNISSSFDHRIVDGYDAALFIQRIKRLLEHPALLFMD